MKTRTPISIEISSHSKELFLAMEERTKNAEIQNIAGLNFALTKFFYDGRSTRGTLTEIYLEERGPWTGKGLPPVGTVCEYQHIHHMGAWYDGKILYISSEYTIVFGDPVNEQHYYTRNLKFCPIRTPEQIEAEEREAEIIEIEQIAISGENSGKTWASAIYDAGYRKQVAP